MLRFLPFVFLPLVAFAAAGKPQENGDPIELKGGLYDSCVPARVIQHSKGEKVWVTGTCQKRDGNQMESHLDLDRCFTWDTLDIKPEKDGPGFSALCHHCKVYLEANSLEQWGWNLKCLCGQGELGYQPFFPFQLNETVQNDDGVLSCFGIKGENGPPPGPQDISTTEKPVRGVYDSCVTVRVIQHAKGEKAWVTALCPERSGGLIESHLDLDQCFSWNTDDDYIQPRKSGNGLSAQCHECTSLQPVGSGLQCLCGQDTQDTYRFNLHTIVINDNDGMLSCFGIKGENGPPPGPQVISATEKRKRG
ncbi:hypothetical protein BDV38DRAFT_288632 [Aspergillus pseudotamarii]|uniref:Cyanovirin-N domain-containing protein n=1 Tax=Aspergillus pseudotamarii TaxID=132259 RepID=A0A5N6SC95_ASPPS|nr:uncharacterized protein BDV38DRAFT_288632 [Aspergillus pseudotamarii]KAE8131479.1 hypothetical protein BDV38DRAFT_288632 [Aspergillus pseudotamarii]